jgi:signal transduction histidine kinase
MPLYISRKKLESEISKRTAEACEQIVSEIGAELHDDLIQKLSVFRLYLDRIERSSDDTLEIQSLAIKMKSNFELVIQTIKNISRRLVTPQLEDSSFANMLEMLCQNMQQSSTANIHIENVGIEKLLKHSVETYLLRIIQELVHNALKHSSAWHIWIRTKWELQSLIIEVEDDGSGFLNISESIQRLKKKNNTLKIRSNAIDGIITYSRGKTGLLVKLKLPI